MSKVPSDKVFVEEPSLHLFCSLCEDILHDPVISVVCGHTFCRACLVENGSTNVVKIAKCPIDGRDLRDSLVVDNRAILSQIEDLRVYCRNGIKRLNSRSDVVAVENGCPETLSFLASDDHNCQFEIIDCPNSTHCGKFKRSKLADHISESCRFVPCSYKISGCNFTGIKERVNLHEKTCPHLPNSQTFLSIQHENTELKNLVTSLNKKMQILVKSNEELTSMFHAQAKLLSTLEEKFKGLEQKVDDHGSKLRSNSFRSRLGSGSLSLSASKKFSFSESNLLRHEEWQVPFEFKCIGTLSGHKGAVRCLATHQHKLYSAGDDSVIKVWDLEALSKGCVQELKGHKDFVNALLTSTNFLYSAGVDRTIRMWKYDVSNTEHNCRKNAHEQNICALAKAGKFIFSSSHSEFKVWNEENLELLNTITGLHHWVRALALDPKKEKLYCGSHNTVTVWDATGQFNMKRKLDHQYGSVFSMVVSNQYLIIGTYNHNCKIFDLASFQEVGACGSHIGTIPAMLVSPDDNFLVTCCYDFKVRKLPNGQKKCVNCNLDLMVYGQGTGTHNRNIQIFHAENHHHVKTLDTHVGIVMNLLLSPDMQFLVSSCFDNTVMIFNLENFLNLQVMARHQGCVNAIALRNGLLFSGSEDKEIKIFKYFRLTSYSSYGIHIRPGQDTY